MTKPELIPIHRGEIQVGQPAPFPLFDANHTLLMEQGSILSVQQLESLLEIGLYRSGDWENNEESLSDPDIPKRPLHFAQLKLLPGSILHLHRCNEEHSGYVAVRLIGWLADEDLIVSAQPLGHDVLLLENGTPLEIKLLAGTGIVTFHSSVQASSDLPHHRYLHLTYPDSISLRQLRKELRVNAMIPATVCLDQDETEYEGGIVNLSACGCLLELPQLFTQVGEALQLNLTLPAIGQAHSFSLRTIVRNIHTDGGEVPVVQYGLEFLDPHTEERLVLEHFIFHRLLEN